MRRAIYMFAFTLFTLGVAVSCRDEKSTGEKIEDAVDDTGDAIEDAVDDAGDAIDDATDDN